MFFLRERIGSGSLGDWATRGEKVNERHMKVAGPGQNLVGGRRSLSLKVR